MERKFSFGDHVRVVRPYPGGGVTPALGLTGRIFGRDPLGYYDYAVKLDVEPEGLPENLHYFFAFQLEPEGGSTQATPPLPPPLMPKMESDEDFAARSVRDVFMFMPHLLAPSYAMAR
jgi:hypothetical protein